LPSPILARADALMHRKRQNDSELDDVPVLTDAIDDDDIPVLFDAESTQAIDAAETEEWPAEEVVETVAETPAEYPAAFAPPEEAAPPVAAAPTLDPGLRDLLVHELARRVEQRLSAELPRIIESTVRDFLAEQEMIASHTAQD
jgi:hypothetical protein